ncbi:MAG: hypothetical protein GEV09_27870, partial [Pseudonocardiaceae bacterium]|nr:hypothetical protein [Pseudonocardiaceae bacterium]
MVRSVPEAAASRGGGPGHRSRLWETHGRPQTPPHAHRRAESRLPRLLRVAAADDVRRHARERGLRLPPDRPPRHAGREAGLRHRQLRRRQAHPEYKAGRPSMPDDLRGQFPIVREIAAMMGMPTRELEGYEADDVIGTLAGKATAAGVDTMIVSGDLDGLQLANDHVQPVEIAGDDHRVDT